MPRPASAAGTPVRRRDCPWNDPEKASPSDCNRQCSADEVTAIPIVTCALGPDNAGPLLARFLARRTSRLDAALYEVGGYYAFLFAHAARGGARTRVLLDAHGGANSTTARLLDGGPVRCRVLRGDCGATAHWKLLIADDGLAVGSGNLIKRDAPRGPLPVTGRSAGLAPGTLRAGLPAGLEVGPVGTREWWVFISAASAMSADARSHFSRSWQESSPPPWIEHHPGRSGERVGRRPALGPGRPPPIGAPHPRVAPLSVLVASRRLLLAVGGGASRSLVGEAMSSGRRRVSVTVPYIHTRAPAVRELLTALEGARRRGAHVRVLLGAPPDAVDAGELRRRALDTRVMDPVRCTTGHAKGVVSDGRVVLGSANWSEPGLGVNREASLLVDHAAAAGYYGGAFERDWAVSLSLDQAGLVQEAPGYAQASPERPMFLE
ncbi:MAG: phospholipase D-like domain-containing protein [Candidatus Dormibacteria bacterium]